jgi:hypothetical protein
MDGQMSAQFGDFSDPAQSARNRHLKVARFCLIVAGLLLASINAYELATIAETTQKEIEAEMGKVPLQWHVGGVVQVEPGPDSQRIARMGQMQVQILALTSVAIAIGVYFVFMALVLKKFPVAATASSLALVVVLALGPAALRLNDLFWRSLIVNVVTFVILLKAIQASLAFRKLAPWFPLSSKEYPTR